MGCAARSQVESPGRGAAEALLPDLRPEVEILLLCARTRLEAEGARRVRALAGRGIEWEFLVQSSLKHRVMPLVYQSLVNYSEDSVPERVLRQFRTHFRANGIRNEVLAEKLLEVLHLLEREAIAAIPFKGPGLALSVYGDLSLRDFGDVDVLVSKRDAANAIEVLLAEGYSTRHELGASEISKRLRSKGSLGFWSPDGVVAVDLQWGVTQLRYFSYHRDSEAFWNRVEQFSFMGVDVLTIACEDLLQMLCVHGSRHCWERLAWVCDVAELVRVRGEMNWEKVIDLAGEQGNLRTLFLGLVLANGLLGADLPERVVRKATRDAVVMSLAAEVTDPICSPEDAPVTTDRQRVAFYFKLQDRLLDKIAYSAHVVRSSLYRRYISRSLK